MQTSRRGVAEGKIVVLSIPWWLRWKIKNSRCCCSCWYRGLGLSCLSDWIVMLVLTLIIKLARWQTDSFIAHCSVSLIFYIRVIEKIRWTFRQLTLFLKRFPLSFLLYHIDANTSIIFYVKLSACLRLNMCVKISVWSTLPDSRTEKAFRSVMQPGSSSLWLCHSKLCIRTESFSL